MICVKGIGNFIAEWIHSNGSDYYSKNDFKRALTLYSRAAIFFPKENIAKCLTNSAACHIMLADYKSSLVDSRKAIEYDKNHERAYERVITACLHLGDLEAVDTALNQLKSINQNNKIIQSTVNSCDSIRTLINEAEMNSRLKNFEKAIEKIDMVLKITTACENSILLRETYLNAKTAQKDATSLLYRDAYQYYTEARLEKCIVKLSEIILINPYHIKTNKLMNNAKTLKDQKELGNLFFSQKKFLKAYQIYRELLKVDPRNVKMQSILHHNLAASNYNLLDCKQGVKDATAALQHNPKYTKALVIRAKCYFKLENYKESTIDCKSVLIIESNDEIESLLKQCRLEESNQLFIKEASIRANSNFIKFYFKDCIINCKQILEIKEIFDIRKLLENAELKESNQIMIAQMLGRARDYYKTNQYDMCVSECDKIREIQTNSDAYHLKENALKQIRNHKSLSDDMIHANDLFKMKQFKESKKYCNIVLDTHLFIVEAKRDQYKIEANILLEKIRKYIEENMFQAKYNFNLENFEHCIINCECILDIEESFEARHLLRSANSEKLIQTDINDKIKRARKYFESESYKDCMQECNQILKIKEKSEARRILNQIREIINSSIEQAKRHLNLEHFDLCIKECEKILNIEESMVARNLLSTAMIEKDICAKIARARKYFESKSYKDCIQECNQVLKIRDLPEARKFLKNIKEIIDLYMAQATRNFNLEYFEQCIKNCESILDIEESSEARHLLRSANSEKQIQADLNDKTKRARKYFESESYKDCMQECYQILKIKEKSEARRILNQIREIINNSIEQAKRHLNLEHFDLCIKDCEKILNIEESMVARNLLSTAMIEKDICEKTARARKYYECESYKDCIKECNQILKIRDLPEARKFLKNIRDIIDLCIAQAKRDFNLEHFEQCIKNCEYILKIEESQEAEDLLDSAKTEKISKSIINEGLNRARRFYKTKHYRECIKECRLLLKIKEVDEASNFIEMCEAAIEAAQSQTTGKLMESAKKFYEMKNYKKCLIDCYKILHMVELKEARDLIKKIKLEKANRKYVNDMMIRAKQHYQYQNYEECISECEIILGIEDVEEAKILMKKAKEEMNRKYINDIMSRAKQNFKNEKYKECIAECLKVLEIEDLMEARTLMVKAKTTMHDKVINDIMSRAKQNFKNEHYKECIAECLKVLEIEDSMDARTLMKKAKTAMHDKVINDIMSRAKQNFKNEQYKECIAECLKVLDIEDSMEARTLMKKAKTAIHDKVINEIMERARRYFKNTNFKECIVECQKALEVDHDFFEAKNLMERARLEILNASRNFVKNKIIQAKLQFDKAEFKDCVETCKTILEQQDVTEVNIMLKQSKDLLAYEKLTDNYDILKVPRYSDLKTVRTSYHALSLLYHPDKHSKSTNEMKKYCENLCKKINVAYKALR